MDIDNSQTHKLSDIRVLMVEDFGVNQEVFRALLENTGIKLDVAYSGTEALKKFKVYDGKHYDVVFMDIQMAEMDGREVAKKIRNLPQVPNAKTIPIIAMSAKNSPEDIEQCLKAGMTDYISKPISREGVMEKIKKYAGVAEAAEPFKSEADDVSPYSQYLPYLDIEDMEKRIGCGIDVCKSLLKDFSSKGYIDEFSRTLQNKDRFRAKEIIHNIKGISSNLSLKELYMMSVEYEQKIKNETDTSSDLEKLKDTIKYTKERILTFTQQSA